MLAAAYPALNRTGAGSSPAGPTQSNNVTKMTPKKRAYGVVVTHQLAKLRTRVRFSLGALELQGMIRFETYI